VHSRGQRQQRGLAVAVDQGGGSDKTLASSQQQRLRPWAAHQEGGVQEAVPAQQKQTHNSRTNQAAHTCRGRLVTSAGISAFSPVTLANNALTDVTSVACGFTCRAPTQVSFSYSVKWKPTSITFDHRMDRYSRYSFLPQHLEVGGSFRARVITFAD
jgi:hypothetical protein